MRQSILPLLLAGISLCAPAQQVKVYPQLETGTHTAQIHRIDIDAAERFLFSASDDKTLRVWDLHSGRLLKTMRPPVGDGPIGMLYSVAASPDGAVAAVGGYTGYSPNVPIYIFDREAGSIRKTISGNPDAANHLAYSKDGRYLAVGFSGKGGIRVYKTDDYSEVARDATYGDNCYWVEFNKSGQLVTASDDGFIRLYGSDFHLLHKEKGTGGTDPFSVRFSPDEKSIAVGFFDAVAIDVLSSKDLSLRYHVPVPTGEGDLATVSWSEDGETLCAGGKYQVRAAYPVLCWSDAGRDTAKTLPVSSGTVGDIRSLRDGSIVFSNLDGEIGLVRSTGAFQWKSTPGLLDFSHGDFSLNVSYDGNHVEINPRAVGIDSAQHTVSFSVVDGKLEDDRDTNTSFLAPVTTGLAIEGWRNTYRPMLDGHALPLEEYERSIRFAISSSKNDFVLGTDWYLRRFDRQGKQIWQTSVSGLALGVNITGDGRFVVAALGDGTIRWYTFDQGREVLALLVQSDMKRWVAWNPDGFFNFDGGGDSLFGYQINHGDTQAGEFVKVDQLREAFYRADLIGQVLAPDAAAKLLVARNQVGDVSHILSGGLPPEVELLSSNQADVGDDGYVLQFRIKDEGGGHGRVVYRIDGVEIEGRSVDIAGSAADTINRRIPIGSGAHTVSVAAYSADGKILGQPKQVEVAGRAPAAGSTPSLYVIAAGITHYSDHSLWNGVKFASADADQVAAKFKQQEGKGLYRKVTAKSLPDSLATVQGIRNAVAEAAKNVQAGDTFVLYLAGHGLAVNGEYYFIPYEAEYTNQDEMLAKSLNREAIQALLKLIPTNKSVLLLDTCNSGAYTEGRDPASEKAALEKVATMSGRAILAASNSDEMAMDGYEGHGVFTYALLQGLSLADSDPQGQIPITRLAEYVQKSVPQLTQEKWHYRQAPLSKMEGEPFPIAHKAAN